VDAFRYSRGVSPGPKAMRRRERRSFELVLLLNASLQPLNVISKRRLVVLLTKQRVTFIDDAARQAVEEALERRRFGQDVVIVRLLTNIQIPRRMLRANRRNLLLRDDGVCQYCGKGLPSSQLSVDHVVPTSRGGSGSSWENQVIACRRCNGRKGNRLLSEAGMRLIRPPRALTQEYAHLIFLRYPQLKHAYDRLLSSARVIA
jgi:5-methylcytosine-specific restriction endonuclease McrA